MFSAATKTDNVSSAANYIEDVFSTYLYTGTGSSQTITNGIDLATYGGLVWNKLRNNGTAYHYWVDTARGRSSGIGSNSTDAQYISSAGNDLASFTTTGYTLGPVQNWNASNLNGGTIVSWTFRKQAKFFDVVTYTGNFVSGVGGTQTINHNLGSAPGCIFVKSVSTAGYWTVYHRELGSNKYVELNTTNQALTNTNVWNNTSPTSTQFSVGAYTDVNKSGETFVAYLFAHDAGGFGATGTDNVISCGSYTGNGSATGPTITLGYEPQLVMIKLSSNSAASGSWYIWDSMRGMSLTSGARLEANLSDAEASSLVIAPNATGFQIVDNSIWNNNSGYTYIYIAIRRGPMKTPTSGTSVFAPLTRNTNGVNTTITTSLTTVDMVMYGDRNGVFGTNAVTFDRLRGYKPVLRTSQTSAEYADATAMTGFDVQKGYGIGTDNNGFGTNYNIGGPYPIVNWQFGRAPGFFDVVCYTGAGNFTTVSHNLGVVPELAIFKSRNTAGPDWVVRYPGTTTDRYMLLNTTGAEAVASGWYSATSSQISFTTSYLGTANSGYTYVAYLFATVAGVSKVGTYTGTGALQTVNCGFAAGARFVLIKRTDSTGDWWVYDSARGITSGNDPYLFLNSTAAEVTTTNYVDTDSTGFKVTAAAPAGLNANGGTYIFLAIA